MAFGIIDTTYVDLPANIDAAYLQGLQTRSGLSVAQMIQDVDAALGAINGGIDPLVADLTSPTSDATGNVRGTSTKRVMRSGEYNVALPQQSSQAGHMLPIAKVELGMGWTEDGLEDISLSAFRQELEDTVSAFQRYYLSEALNRLLSNAEVRVDEKTAVTSPGFAGSGTGSNVFSGVYPDGTALPGGYSHYMWSTPAALATTIKTAVAQLAKWQTGPFDMIASPTALADVVGLAGFVSAGSALVRPGSGSSEALVDASSYVGVLNGNIKVRNAVDGIGATKHISIFKSFGPFAAGNPLAWRYDDLKGREAYARSRALYPLADAIALQWLGFGVNDRAGAVNIFVDVAPGAYTNPTITIV